MSTVTIGGTTYTTDSRGNITSYSGSGGIGSTGLNIASIKGYNSGSSNTATMATTPAASASTARATTTSTSAPAATTSTSSSYTPAIPSSNRTTTTTVATPRLSYADQLANGYVVNMQDYLTSLGQPKAAYNATTNKVTINGVEYSPGTIPGTYFDRGTSTHYVTNADSFSSILPKATATPTQTTTEQPNQTTTEQPNQITQPNQVAQVPQNGITPLPATLDVDTE